MQLWCVKWENGTTVSRGCADVVLCPDEEDGCFPEHDKDATVKWCCCNEDLCNSSASPHLLFFLSMFSVYMLFLL
ncbi:unnamed protein product [Strongylus vulgaris]|uniref:Activin types I and II receptor domain-containing protein n=1 Tax=Strongylus vulgaris TaxID=40348 RepID=A0A3P7IY30_STRVU|nr:unnamed protein product [Strongylus vulgaris]